MQDGQVAVVTGGGQGIGAAICKQLASRGYHVAILDKNCETGELVAKTIEASGGWATPMQCELTEIEEVKRAADSVREGIGRVDVLVNCAGWTPNEQFADQDPELWRRIIDVNYTAVLNTCHVFGPDLADGSAIVNISSDAARAGVSGQAVYAGAKAAVIAFSKSIALEVAHRQIRVNVVCPGSTQTPMLESIFTEEELAKRVRIIPLRRFGEPDDVAGVVTFLAIDATHVTGQVISVNGGALRAG